MIKLFISHSSLDLVVIEPLVELLKNAIDLPAREIRCTSLDGYRLPAGADMDELVRTEVQDAHIFIGLISRASVGSMYVAFELGARWGLRKPLIPLLAPGASTRLLGGPLMGLNALRLDSVSQIHQLVSELARELGKTPVSAAVYQKYIDSILSASVSKPETSTFQGQSNSQIEQSPRRGTETSQSVDQELERLISDLSDPSADPHDHNYIGPALLKARRFGKKAGLSERFFRSLDVLIGDIDEMRTSVTYPAPAHISVKDTEILLEELEALRSTDVEVQ